MACICIVWSPPWNEILLTIYGSIILGAADGAVGTLKGEAVNMVDTLLGTMRAGAEGGGRQEIAWTSSQASNDQFTLLFLLVLSPLS